MNDTSVTLAQAFRFVESGELGKARALLEPLRGTLADSADFWWVYAHALEDDRQGREALQRVYNIDPDYPGIAPLADELSLVRSAVHQERPVPSTSLEPEDLSFLVGKRRDAGNSRLRRILIPLVLILLVVLGIGLLLPRLNQQSSTTLPTVTGQNQATTGTPTESIEIAVSEEPISIALDPALAPDTAEITEEPSSDVSGLNTPEPSVEPIELTETSPTDTIDATPTLEAAGAQSAALESLLESFDLPEQGTRVEQTVLGNTLVVDTCSAPGPQASFTIVSIAQLLGANPEVLPADVEGLAIRIVDCDSDTVLRVVGISRESLLTQDTRDIQAALQPID